MISRYVMVFAALSVFKRNRKTWDILIFLKCRRIVIVKFTKMYKHCQSERESERDADRWTHTQTDTDRKREEERDSSLKMLLTLQYILSS